MKTSSIQMPVDLPADDELAGMAGVFNGLIIASAFYLTVFGLWWVW